MAHETLEQRLARLIERALREQPAVPAPPTLVVRVHRAIEAHGLRPWWQQPLSDWPRLARVAMLATCVGCAALLWLIAARAGSPSPLSALAPPVWFAQTVAAVDGLERMRELAAAALHSRLLYQGCALLAMVYLLLFALLATGYALLWSPWPARAAQSAAERVP